MFNNLSKIAQQDFEEIKTAVMNSENETEAFKVVRRMHGISAELSTAFAMKYRYGLAGGKTPEQCFSKFYADLKQPTACQAL